jgi:hypothetical protein
MTRPLTIALTVLFTGIAIFVLAQFVNLGFFNIGREAAIVSNHNVVLERIEALGKLELVKYKFRDVLEHKIEYDWYPDSKALLIISGEAVGCIDLKKVKATDILDRKDTLYIRLPAPELCYYKINHNESQVYSSSHGFNDGAKLLGGAYKEAEKQMKRTALQTNIMEQTRKNGEQLLRPLFEQLAKKKVVFTYAPSTEGQDLKKK